MSATSSSSSSTLQDDSTSATLSPVSPSPSPPFFESSSPHDDSASSQSSTDWEEDQVVSDGECNMSLSGGERLFGYRDLDDNDLSHPIGIDDGSLSAQTLDRILLRAEARLRQQEEFARELNLTPEPAKIATRIQPKLSASLIDCSKSSARPNNKLLVSNDLRKLADKSRVVNDPLVVRKAVKEKSKLSHCLSPPSNMMIQRFVRHLDAIIWPVLGTVSHQ
jgi:hypothetical protein